MMSVHSLFFNGLQSVKVWAETMPAQARAMAAAEKAFVNIVWCMYLCVM